MLFVICEKGSDRYLLSLYKHGVIDILLSQIDSDTSVDSLYQCLKCIRKMLKAESKMKSL
jgi:flagellar biosynthesis regulator FlbT